jgi:hypothetical protein
LALNFSKAHSRYKEMRMVHIKENFCMKTWKDCTIAGILALIAAAALFFTACETDTEEAYTGYTLAGAHAITVANGEVYTAGVYTSVYHTGSGWKPCYWKNAERIDLPIPATSIRNNFVNAIAVENGEVYTVGRIDSTACYWKGTVRTDFPSGISYANAITVANGEVYTAGGNGNNACYWKGTAKTDLPGGTNSWAGAIAVTNGEIYTAGYWYISGWGSITLNACYWKGTARTDLPSDGRDSSANALAVENGAVYTAGRYYDDDGNVKACYWKGTVKTDLPIPATAKGAPAQALTVINGIIYTAGYYVDDNGTEKACYWKGTERIDLPVTHNARATGIVAVNEDVYVSGLYGKKPYADMRDMQACYWKNGIKIDLEPYTQWSWLNGKIGNWF